MMSTFLNLGSMTSETRSRSFRRILRFVRGTVLFESVVVIMTSIFFLPSLWDSAVQLGSIWTAR